MLGALTAPSTCTLLLVAVGVLVLLRLVGSAPFDPTDLATAESYAGQAAIALVLAEARHAQDVAAEQQLPLEVAARYGARTAQIVGAHIGLEPIPDDRFKETDTGDWTDLTHHEVQQRDPQGFWGEAAAESLDRATSRSVISVKPNAARLPYSASAVAAPSPEINPDSQP